jgi:hypothetical protein
VAFPRFVADALSARSGDVESCCVCWLKHASLHRLRITTYAVFPMRLQAGQSTSQIVSTAKLPEHAIDRPVPRFIARHDCVRREGIRAGGD